MPDVPHITLNDGHLMPRIGFGVWQVENDKVGAAVTAAIDAGYTMIDTAQGYDNEAGVGAAIAASGARDRLFITSKLRTRAQGFDDAVDAFNGSMRDLDLDVLDLFLIHWPVPAQDKYVEAWKALVHLREQGRVRSIGVSNFLPEHIERIIAETGVAPAVNQIELHPYYQQQDVRDFHAQNQIAIECYSPLGSGAVLEDETIAAIAERHGRTPAQIILAWELQQGLIVIPKSVHPERIRENFDVFDIDLTEDDMRELDALDDPQSGKQAPHPARNNDVW